MGIPRGVGKRGPPPAGPPGVGGEAADGLRWVVGEVVKDGGAGGESAGGDGYPLPTAWPPRLRLDCQAAAAAAAAAEEAGWCAPPMAPPMPGMRWLCMRSPWFMDSQAAAAVACAAAAAAAAECSWPRSPPIPACRNGRLEPGAARWGGSDDAIGCGPGMPCIGAPCGVMTPE